MGWKSIKEHYQIKHIVHIDGGRVLFGSGYVPDAIVVEPDGTIVKTYRDSMSGDLSRYCEEIGKDPDTFAEMFKKQDVFARSIPVYTFDRDRIIEKFCDELEWPNVTHDGMLMYSNQFFATREDAIAQSKRNARAGMEIMQENVAGAERELANSRERLADYEMTFRKLEGDYPDVSPDRA